MPLRHRRGGLGGEGQLRDDAQDAAPAAARGPEELAVRRAVRGVDRPVGRHELDLGELIAREPEGAHQHADPTPERQAGDADGRARAARDRPTPRADGVVDGGEGRARPHDHRTPVGAECDRVERGRADHEGRRDAAACRSARRPADVVVAAGAEGDREPVLPGEGQRGADVGRARHLQDRERFRGVESGILGELGGREPGTARQEERAGDGGLQRSPVGWSDRRGRRARGMRRGRAAREEQGARCTQNEASSTQLGHASSVAGREWRRLLSRERAPHRRRSARRRRSQAARRRSGARRLTASTRDARRAAARSRGTARRPS